MSIKLTESQINELLNEDTPFQEAIFWEKVMVRSYRLPNGFTITGFAACVDPKTFVYEVGAGLCLRDARRQLWGLEAYILHNNSVELHPN